ncbi:uncharacterized protein SPSK_09974 [Sporothrix schenckii 1099-18]|uniref:Uncharacterized protein n=1 Tax=Sporothrix schenckii 1099-18 TaxID=1397361 RepID=A0A0F2M5U3_SPOSC|nr:uncharacterized protein SPSK_09974 [Sporothrix schenckii 1099-18]KJR84997.1 hypothetical protein SPSK_09974 [Sporothrix schenckii 1099-18]
MVSTLREAGEGEKELDPDDEEAGFEEEQAVIAADDDDHDSVDVNTVVVSKPPSPVPQPTFTVTDQLIQDTDIFTTLRQTIIFLNRALVSDNEAEVREAIRISDRLLEHVRLQHGN